MENISLVDTMVEWVKNYDGIVKDSTGNVTEQSLLEFAKAIQNKLNDVKFTGDSGAVLPYCGGTDIDGTWGKGYEIVKALCDGNKYGYISGTELGNLVNEHRFIEALVGKVEVANANLLLHGGENSAKEIISGSGVLNLSDYTSERFMLEAASEDVKPLIFETAPNKVFVRTEFEALLNNDKVTSIWGVDKAEIKGVVYNYKKYSLSRREEEILLTA